MGCHVQQLLGLFLLLIFFVDYSYSCQGHKIKVNYIKNCGDTASNVIKVRENSTIDMTSNCEIVPNACGETIGFKSAHVTYQVWKNNMPILRNELDACDAITKVNADIRTMLKVFGLPNKCPVEKMSKCEDGSNKGDMESFKKFLTLARGGPIKVEVKIDHDNGKSCFKSEFEVVKK